MDFTAFFPPQTFLLRSSHALFLKLNDNGAFKNKTVVKIENKIKIFHLIMITGFSLKKGFLNLENCLENFQAFILQPEIIKTQL